MTDQTPEDIIGILLAAKREPKVMALDEFASAQAMIDEDADLRSRFEEAEARFSQNEDVLHEMRLSDQARDRILQAVTQAGQTERDTPKSETFIIPFPLFFRIAAAAVLLGLVAVPFALKSGGPQLAEHTEPPQLVQAGYSLERFRDFAANAVESGFNLDHKTPQPKEAIKWLTAQDSPVCSTIPEALMNSPSMGCKVLEWGGQKVSMICFQTKDKEVVHLFITSNPLATETVEAREEVDGRECSCWQNEFPFFYRDYPQERTKAHSVFYLIPCAAW